MGISHVIYSGPLRLQCLLLVQYNTVASQILPTFILSLATDATHAALPVLVTRKGSLFSRLACNIEKLKWAW